MRHIEIYDTLHQWLEQDVLTSFMHKVTHKDFSSHKTFDSNQHENIPFDIINIPLNKCGLIELQRISDNCGSKRFESYLTVFPFSKFTFITHFNACFFCNPFAIWHIHYWIYIHVNHGFWLIRRPMTKT